METEKKEVIFKIKNLKTWFPITKGFMKKVVGNVKAMSALRFIKVRRWES